MKRILIILSLILFASGCVHVKPAPVLDALLVVEVPQKKLPLAEAGYTASELAQMLNEAMRALCTNAERQGIAIHYLSNGKREVEYPDAYMERCLSGVSK